MRKKPILAVDFDGVIHTYGRGWADGTIYGELTKGFPLWLREAQKHFRIYVHSSRAEDSDKITKMEEWMQDKLHEFFRTQEHYDHHEVDDMFLALEFTNIKPPAMISIDDRAMTFKGDWNDFPVDKLLSFRPWNLPS